jgi:hypothetical protein
MKEQSEKQQFESKMKDKRSLETQQIEKIKHQKMTVMKQKMEQELERQVALEMKVYEK